MNQVSDYIVQPLESVWFLLHFSFFKEGISFFDMGWCINNYFNNISAISVLVVEEAGVPGKNHRPRASNW